MMTDEVKNLIEQQFGARATEISAPAPRRLFVTVAPADLPELARCLLEKGGFTHISTISARDTGESIAILYHFSKRDIVLTVKTVTLRDQPAVPTITPYFPGATLYEREIHDILGVKVEGHPDLRMLVLPDDWPQGVYPLRKDWHYNRETEVIR